MLFGKLKLTSKLAVIIGAVLAVIFALLIGVTISTTSTSIQKGIAGELSALARTTGTEIQDSLGLWMIRPGVSRNTSAAFTPNQMALPGTPLPCSRAPFIRACP